MISIRPIAASCVSTPNATPKPPAISATPRNIVNDGVIPILLARLFGSLTSLHPLGTPLTVFFLNDRQEGFVIKWSIVTLPIDQVLLAALDSSSTAAPQHCS